MDALVLFVAVLSAGIICVMSAPSDQLSACMTITQEDAKSMATCCNYAVPFSNQTMMNCQKKEASGDLKKEFECIPDCLFSSDRLLKANQSFINKPFSPLHGKRWKTKLNHTDKKFDKEKWRNNVEKTVPKDWKNVIANSPNECGEFEKILGPQMPKQCPTTELDMVFNCMSVQWYLKCPKSAWKSSKTCDDTREKFSKCYEFVFPK